MDVADVLLEQGNNLGKEVDANGITDELKAN